MARVETSTANFFRIESGTENQANGLRVLKSTLERIKKGSS